MKLTRNLAAASLVFGAAVGGITLSGALAGSPDPGEARVKGEVVEFIPDVAMPPLTDKEPLVFSDVVSSIGKTSSISRSEMTLLEAANQDGVCYEISMPQVSSEGCMSSESISTGLAYMEFNNEGRIEVFGIVPDEVGRVQIDGVEVELANNVWHFVPSEGQRNVQLQVDSADGAVTAVLGK